MSWNAWPVAPKPAPDPPRLTALLDAVDAHLCGLLTHDQLRAAWRQAKNPKP